jgi:hypothetical protein
LALPAIINANAPAVAANAVSRLIRVSPFSGRATAVRER